MLSHKFTKVELQQNIPYENSHVKSEFASHSDSQEVWNRLYAGLQTLGCDQFFIPVGLLALGSQHVLQSLHVKTFPQENRSPENQNTKLLIQSWELQTTTNKAFSTGVYLQLEHNQLKHRPYPDIQIGRFCYCCVYKRLLAHVQLPYIHTYIGYVQTAY